MALLSHITAVIIIVTKSSSSRLRIMPNVTNHKHFQIITRRLPYRRTKWLNMLRHNILFYYQFYYLYQLVSPLRARPTSPLQASPKLRECILLVSLYRWQIVIAILSDYNFNECQFTRSTPPFSASVPLQTHHHRIHHKTLLRWE